MAFFSGFDGQRATQAWASRIDILERLGFVKLAPGPSGDRSYALILNPYLVVKKIYNQRGTKVLTKHYNALVARATEIKADDI